MNSDWLAQFDCHLIDKWLRHTDAIIGCAEYITDHVRTPVPSLCGRCTTIYNGADIAELSSQPDIPLKSLKGKRFIFVGRVSPEKIHVLLEAFKKVVRSEPEAELEIGGAADISPRSFIVDQSNDLVVQHLDRFYALDYMECLQNHILLPLEIAPPIVQGRRDREVGKWQTSTGQKEFIAGRLSVERHW